MGGGVAGYKSGAHAFRGRDRPEGKEVVALDSLARSGEGANGSDFKEERDEGFCESRDGEKTQYYTGRVLGPNIGLEINFSQGPGSRKFLRLI